MSIQAAVAAVAAADDAAGYFVVSSRLLLDLHNQQEGVMNHTPLP